MRDLKRKVDKVVSQPLFFRGENVSHRQDNGSTTQHERRIITSIFRSGEDLAGHVRSRNRHPGTLTNQDFMGENVGIL